MLIALTVAVIATHADHRQLLAAGGRLRDPRADRDDVPRVVVRLAAPPRARGHAEREPLPRDPQPGRAGVAVHAADALPELPPGASPAPVGSLLPLRETWRRNEEAYLERDAAIATAFGKELNPDEFREWKQLNRKLLKVLPVRMPKRVEPAARRYFTGCRSRRWTRSPRTATLVTFDVPETLRDQFRFEPGQHVTVRTDLGGEGVRRNYSICAPATRAMLRIAVKHIPGGAFSTFVARAAQGRRRARGDDADRPVLHPASPAATPSTTSRSRSAAGSRRSCRCCRPPWRSRPRAGSP